MHVLVSCNAWHICFGNAQHINRRCTIAPICCFTVKFGTKRFRPKSNTGRKCWPSTTYNLGRDQTLVVPFYPAFCASKYYFPNRSLFKIKSKKPDERKKPVKIGFCAHFTIFLGEFPAPIVQIEQLNANFSNIWVPNRPLCRRNGKKLPLFFFLSL